MEPKCEPVRWPATPEEVAAEITRNPNEARVRRPDGENPAAPPDTPEARAVAGLDLTDYFYRAPEAGVNAGGVWGRWFVSVTADSVIPGRTVRPAPIRLDNGRPLVIEPVLDSGSLSALVSVSGSTIAGETVFTIIGSPELAADLEAARSLNPHRSPVGNGRIPVGGALVTVGCSVPVIPVSVNGLERIYLDQSGPLFRAGISYMNWIFDRDGFRTDDLYRQINWTITPDAPTVSGSWEETEWAYNASEYDAYRKEIIRADVELRQPSTEVSGSVEGLALNRERLETYLTEVVEIWNRINRDSNVIRGLQINGGNERMRQQPRRAVGFRRGTVITYGGGGGGGAVGGQFSYVYDPSTGLLREVPTPGNLN